MRVLWLCLFLAACGGGSETDVDDTSCFASSVHEANKLIQKYGSVNCRHWTINDKIVDGAAYPDFLIGEEE